MNAVATKSADGRTLCFKAVFSQDQVAADSRPVAYGSFWGEVKSNLHRVLGCVGTITDGAIRDVDEMTNAGFNKNAKGKFGGQGEW